MLGSALSAAHLLNGGTCRARWQHQGRPGRISAIVEPNRAQCRPDVSAHLGYGGASPGDKGASAMRALRWRARGQPLAMAWRLAAVPALCRRGDDRRPDGAAIGYHLKRPSVLAADVASPVAPRRPRTVPPPRRRRCQGQATTDIRTARRAPPDAHDQGVGRRRRSCLVGLRQPRTAIRQAAVPSQEQGGICVCWPLDADGDADLHGARSPVAAEEGRAPCRISDRRIDAIADQRPEGRSRQARMPLSAGASGRCRPGAHGDRPSGHSPRPQAFPPPAVRTAGGSRSGRSPSGYSPIGDPGSPCRERRGWRSRGSLPPRLPYTLVMGWVSAAATGGQGDDACPCCQRDMIQERFMACLLFFRMSVGAARQVDPWAAATAPKKRGQRERSPSARTAPGTRRHRLRDGPISSAKLASAQPVRSVALQRVKRPIAPLHRQAAGRRGGQGGHRGLLPPTGAQPPEDLLPAGLRVDCAKPKRTSKRALVRGPPKGTPSTLRMPFPGSVCGSPAADAGDRHSR